MSRQEIKLTAPAGVLRWVQLYRLYLKAFPPSERKPFSIIAKRHRSGKNDLWCLERDSKFLGFAAMVNAEQTVLLDYLAVEPRLRGQGIGTQALAKLKETYPRQGFFVEIESPFEPGVDQIQRQKRKQFYLHSDMKPMKVMADVFGVKMELLGWNCCMDYERYHQFYYENLSPWAAEHVTQEDYPEGK